jgi:hypothetical protein
VLLEVTSQESRRWYVNAFAGGRMGGSNKQGDRAVPFGHAKSGRQFTFEDQMS